MRIGVFLLAAGFPGMAAGEVLRDTVDAIVAAERAGFDDAWIAEHHFMSYGVCPSAATLAAVALGRTSTIDVGTAVSVLSTHHPVALAEQAAILHHVSGGRFHLGVGRGGPWVDLEVFGTGISRFERGFPESLDLLCAALGQDTIVADGEFFRFREVPIVPAARMSPFVACTSPATVSLAAERGLPMLLGLHIGDQEKATMLAEYAASTLRHHPKTSEGEGGGVTSPAAGAYADGEGPLEEVGHIGAAVAYVGDSTARAVADLREAMPRWLEPGLAGYLTVDGRPHPQRDIHRYVDMLCDIHPVGSADRCVDAIRRTAERAGLRHLILMVEGGGDRARTLENIARLGAEVLPHLR